MADKSTPLQVEDPTIDWMFCGDAPDWTVNTPGEDDYELIMWNGAGGGACQQVPMSRTEFLVLKAYLAAMRGYVVEGNLNERLTEVASRINANPGTIPSDIDQIVNSLQIAREMFQRCPDLVMLKSETLDPDLDGIHERAAAVPNRPESA